MSSENHVISFDPPQRAHKRDRVTSKASKLRPKGLFGGLQEPQEGRNKHPKEAQEAPKDSPREPKKLPKGDQNHRKLVLEAIWAPQEEHKAKMQ